MSVEFIQTLSTCSYISAGVFLVLSIVLFFLLDIKKVIGDVSGSTAKKAIENIRQQNEESGNKAHKPSPVNKERGRVTDKITQSGSVVKKPDTIGVAVGTSKLKGKNTMKPNDQNTVVLTDNLNYQSNETSVLFAKINDDFSIDYEIGFCASNEIIS